jgi:hypothetical protein
MTTQRIEKMCGLLAACIVLGLGSQLSIAQQTPAAARHTVDMTVVKPETVGFSSERLKRLHAIIQDR